LPGRYDFNHPEAIPESLHHLFDCVVIDPPFITREVWEKYASAAKLLLVKEPTAGEGAPRSDKHPCAKSAAAFASLTITPPCAWLREGNMQHCS